MSKVKNILYETIEQEPSYGAIRTLVEHNTSLEFLQKHYKNKYGIPEHIIADVYSWVLDDIRLDKIKQTKIGKLLYK